MPEGDGSQAALPGVPPHYWRFLRASLELIEAGQPVTYGNLAKKLNRAKQVVWKFVRRHPDVWAFIDDEIRAANQKFYGLVQRRMAFVAMQGSAQHAEVYFKSEAGQYAKPVSADGAVVAPGAFTLNLLVPRPENAQLPGQPAVAALPPSAIPTVALR